MIRTTEDVLQLLMDNPNKWIDLKFCLNIECTVTHIVSVLDVMGMNYLTYPYFLSGSKKEVKYIMYSVGVVSFTTTIGEPL